MDRPDLRLCTICARGGSKGVAGKNLRLLAGLPLVAHSVRQALASGLFDVVAVSSDSEAILDAAQAAGAGVRVRRPDELATDQAAKLPAIRHCAAAAEAARGRRYAVVVDLDATSPLRHPEDIRGAVSLLDEPGVEIVLTAAPARRSPYFNLLELGPSGAPALSKAPPAPIERRQDAPRCFDMNASIYAWRRDALFARDSLFGEATRLFVMPEERSIDIDSELDFRVVEMLMKERVRDA